jgi:hypothetical protein
MAIYTVHLPDSGNVEHARFIREGASVFALILPLVWLIWQRLWLALTGYVAVLVAVSATAIYAGETIAGLLSLVPALFLFVEGNQFIRRRLERAGWQFAGVVDATSAVDAEIRYFGQQSQSHSGKLASRQKAPAAGTGTTSVSAPSCIGMFPE